MPGSYVSALFHADDNVGRPLVGGKLYTFANNSTIPVTTYQDAAGTIANTNPIILSGRGEAVIFLPESQICTFVLRDASDALIWSQNDITADSTDSGTGSGLVAYSTPPTSDVGPIYWIGYGPAEWNGTQYVTNYTTGLGGGAWGFKNKVRNGDFISATNGSSFNLIPANSGLEVMDSWFALCTGASRYTIAQGSDLSNYSQGAYGRSYAVITSTASAASVATDDVRLANRIKGFDAGKFGFGGGAGNTVTLSFRVRCSTPGRYCGSISNPGGTRSYVFEYTVNLANTVEYKTVTLPVDTLDPGNWPKGPNTLGLVINFDLGGGSNYETPSPNTWQAGFYYRTPGAARVTSTNGRDYQITEVQLQQGDKASPYEDSPYWYNRIDGFAVNADLDLGLNDDQIVTPAGLRNAFSISLAANGHIKLPSWLGGLQICWGNPTTSSGGGIAVAFSRAFTIAPYAVNATPNVAGILPICVTASASATTATFFASNPSGTGVSGTALFYIAIGRG